MFSGPEFLAAFLLAFLGGLVAGGSIFGTTNYIEFKTYQLARFLLLIVFVVVLVLVICTALEAWVYSMRLHPPDLFFFSWLEFGRGRSMLGGAAAGLLASAAMQLVIQMSAQGAPALATGVVAVGPAVAIIALYAITNPEALHQLGLTDIKAGGIEVRMAQTVAPTVTIPATEFSMPAISMKDTEETWFPWLRDLTGQTPKPKYFEREIPYIELIDGGVPKPARDAIDRQKALLYAIGPLIACEAFVDKTIVFDSRQLGRENSGIINALVALDLGFRHLADELPRNRADELAYARPFSQDFKPEAFRRDFLDLGDLTTNLADQINSEFRRLRSLIPSYLMRNGFGDSDQAANDCVVTFTTPSAVLGPLDDSYTWTPPYIAIFAAHAYAAEESYEAGLKVLDNWIAEDRRSDPSHSLSWLRDRAELQFTIIQRESVSGVTMNSALLRSLYIVSQRLKTDWKVDLGMAENCPLTPATLFAPATAGKTVTTYDPRTLMQANLTSAYAAMVGAWLHAVVDTRSADTHEQLGPLAQAWAEELIKFGRKCLPGETPDERQKRQANALLEGGRTLAWWATDGSREGVLTGAEADAIRKEAAMALWEALGQLDDLETEDDPPAPLPIGSSNWELYRRLAQHEILALDAELPH